MRSRYRVTADGAAHFVTSTIVEWLPVFTTDHRCDLLVRSFEYCRTNKDLKIYGWVILDNHFHAIVSAPQLPQVMSDLKRHTARKIVTLLHEQNAEWLLNQFQHYRARHKSQSEFQIWQEGYQPQSIASDEIMLQKLEYLHNNPVKRGLVAAPEHWRYSSAHEWLDGAMPVLRCDDWG